MMEIYLDNSATTRAYGKVAEIVSDVMTKDYGNPSSLHRKGIDAENYIRGAKDIIASTLRVDQKELLFTSGGTESDNLAIIGSARAYRRDGRHLITTQVEHPAVLNSMRYLESEGYEVTYLPVDAEGRVRIEDLTGALRPDTILVSVMYVNNEIGAVQPIAEISKVLDRCARRPVFHVDAVQAFGKMRIYPKRLGIDLMSVSGHKIHGPKGIGLLYASGGTKLCPTMFGGGQQKDLRPGTENVPGIAGLGEAVKEIYTDFDEKTAALRELRAYFVEEIKKIDGVTVNGAKPRESAPHIVSVSFAGVRSEVLLHALEERGIYVSSGSACSSNHPGISSTLKSIGVKKELLDSTLRFSFSEFTTAEELDFTLKTLQELLPFLRRFTRH